MPKRTQEATKQHLLEWAAFLYAQYEKSKKNLPIHKGK